MENWDPEQRMIADAFQKGMAPFQQEPLVLYGTGKNTPAVLELTQGFTFAGLMDRDADNIGKVFYGKQVLSPEDVAASSKKIVIIARNTIVPIIYRRIRDFAEKNGISIYHYTGRLLKETEQTNDAADLDYWNHSYEDLKAAVAGYDVISFDIFDTLVGRRVLQPKDIFSLVERDLGRIGCQASFAELRIQAEKACGYAASLDDIYKQLYQMGISEEDCHDWQLRELEWEKKVVFPRKRMAEVFQYAKELGKKIVLTSDMYLSKGKIHNLLERCGIVGYDELLISCQEKAEKSDGKLFAKLLERAGGKSILHIGDNPFSDGEMAQSMGLDTWQVYSSYDMLSVSSIRSLAENPPKELGGRLALGLLCAKLFADPFALHETKGALVLSQPEQVGYSFIGPWALSFMQWAAEQIKNHGIEEFIFPSRDGFLFYNMGQIMQKYGYMPDVALKYIKASRCALTVVSIQSETDLKDTVTGKACHCTKGEFLKEWFRVQPKSSDTEQWDRVVEKDLTVRYLCTYLPQIMERAAWERKNYQAYLQSMDLFHDRKTAVFDFFAKGTVQHYLECQLGKRMLGLYCGRNIITTAKKEEIWEEPDILSAFGTFYAHDTSLEFSLLQVYLIMEALLVDGNRTLMYFDENIRPVFGEDRGITYEQALQIHKFALAFTDDYLELLGGEPISLISANQFLGTLFGQGCQIIQPAEDAFIHDDTWEVSDENDKPVSLLQKRI